MWGQAITSPRQEGKTAFIEAVQVLNTEKEIAQRQRDKLFVMLASVGVRRGILDRVLEEAEKEITGGD
jgi:hypothetical protein